MPVNTVTIDFSKNNYLVEQTLIMNASDRHFEKNTIVKPALIILPAVLSGVFAMIAGHEPPVRCGLQLAAWLIFAVCLVRFFVAYGSLPEEIGIHFSGSGGFDVITGILSSVTSFFISFIFSIYLLGNKDKLALQAKKVVYAILSEERADKLMRIARLSNRTFGNFISGQCLDAFMLGCEFILVLSILQMPYALLIGILCMLCALIPILGSFIGLAIGALLILLISPIKALIFIIVFTALQQFDANFVYPHVVGSSVGLPGMWVLMSVTVGGSLFGLVGMLILIPVASVLYTLFREHVYKKLAEKDVDPDKYLTVPEKEEGLLESLKKVKIGGKRSEKKAGNADDMIDDDDDDDDGEDDDDDSDDDDEVKSAEEIMEDIKEEIGITPMAKNTGAPAKKRKKR